mgnify:CR=1 FL=1
MKIQKAITDCRLFIPLISKNSLDPGRYTIKEWDTAMNGERWKIAQQIQKELTGIEPHVMGVAPSQNRHYWTSR